MKLSEAWLREWVNPTLDGTALCDKLTMSGLEVEERLAVAGNFSNVVVAEILSVTKHPEADRLNVCQVNIGDVQPVQIVCGAANVRVGMKVPAAKIGAVLSEKLTIKQAALRGVDSFGMLCSASELGLTEDSQGLLELPIDAPVGMDVRAFLQLDDSIIDVSITPNRGDCLSVRGMAREVAALTRTPMQQVALSQIPAKIQDTFNVDVSAAVECPRYVGRVIRRVNAAATSPVWLREKLRRSGVRSINPIVDVTNYVMLELGQPMHAFDLEQIQQEIQVRLSVKGEKIILLDGSEKELDDETLVIADQRRALAIAGVMGGLDSGVTSTTKDIFLESAFFLPLVVARQRQFYQLNSDSSYRFERGVDSTIQRQAIERATQLIVEIVGGEPGPVIEIVSENNLPAPKSIHLVEEKIERLLGLRIPKSEVEAIFAALNFAFVSDQQGWRITIPAYRSDISIPEDVIEEIARLYGYDQIPATPLRANLQIAGSQENAQDLHDICLTLRDLGYHQIISYSFIDKKWQRLFDPERQPRELVNPMTAEMEVMRTNLWPGLVNTFLYNKSRQQHRIRLFETGSCFIVAGDELKQPARLGGLIAGSVYPEQWGVSSRPVDFYDLKGDVESLLSQVFPSQTISFKPDHHPALHPGQAAGIYHDGQKIGIMGALHPSLLQSLDINTNLYVFELDQDLLRNALRVKAKEISRFPENRRDIAIIVNQAVPAEDIQATIRAVAGDWLKETFIFDLYQGKGISPGMKSIALALIWQHPTRTLVDDEVAELMDRVVGALKGQLGAELRS